MEWLLGAAGGKQRAPRALVTVHVYDLGPAFGGVNMVGRAIGTGAFHAGVEVDGAEWSFSCGQDGPYRSGIFAVPPRGCDAHVYREAVPMGQTSMSAHEVRALINQLYKEWPGAQYDLLRHNCCHFSDELCVRLGVGHIPTWITSLAGVGAMLHNGWMAAMAGAVAAPGAVGDGIWGARVAVADLVGDAFQRPLEPKAPDVSPGGYRGDVRRKTETGTRSGAVSSEAIKAAEVAMQQGAAQEGQLVRGDAVEVWSNSHQAWCPGKVESIREDGMVDVTFRLPVDKSNLAQKLIPMGHHHMRKVPPKTAEQLVKGDAVEVWSNSAKAWCPGYVEKVFDGMLYLEFRLPGARQGELSQKQLPLGHKDARPAAAAPTSPSDAASAAAPPRTDADTKARDAASAQLSKALQGGDLEAVQRACTVAEAAGVPVREIEAAQVAAVQIAVKEELRAARESADARWIEQACRRAEDAGVPLADIREARAVARRIFAHTDLMAAVQCSDLELLEEAITVAKEAGVPAHELDSARRQAAENVEAERRRHEAEAAERAVAERAAAERPQPLGTTARPCGPDFGDDQPPGGAPRAAPFDTMGPGGGRPPSTMVVLPSIGDWVEVFSNSHKAWCLGRITKVTPEGPTVVFQLPGAKESDDWYEKMVPTGYTSRLLRRPPAVSTLSPGMVPATSPLAVAAALGSVAGCPTPAWTAEEMVAYSNAWRELAAKAASAGRGSNGSSVDQDTAGQYLRRSGLPRKMLKEIWLVANPGRSVELEPSQLSICMRLIGHCQAVLDSGDIAAADVLVEGGEALRSLLENDFLHRPPKVLPRFQDCLRQGEPLPSVAEIVV